MTRLSTSAATTPTPINRFSNKQEARNALPLAQRAATRDTRDRLAVEPILYDDGKIEHIQYAIAVYSGITGFFQRYY